MQSALLFSITFSWIFLVGIRASTREKTREFTYYLVEKQLYITHKTDNKNIETLEETLLRSKIFCLKMKKMFLNSFLMFQICQSHTISLTAKLPI